MSAYVTCTCGAEIDYIDRVCSLGHFQTWLPAAGRPITSEGYSRWGATPEYLTYSDITAHISATRDVPLFLIEDVLDELGGMGVDIHHLVKIKRSNA